MSGDAAMRQFGANSPVPEFDSPAFTPLGKPLSEARVAIVTSAALHGPNDKPFSQGDTSYRSIDRSDRDLVLGHWSPNFDRREAALELATGPVPGGRAAEAWFFEATEAGKIMLAARASMKEQEAPFPLWFYMAPAHR